MAEPEPEREAYKAPASSSTRFTLISSGYFGKTTRSKSFSIPVRTRSRSGFSARPLPLGTRTPDKAFPVLILFWDKPLSHAENLRPHINILSEGVVTVNFARLDGVASSPSFADGRSSSQSANALGVEMLILGVAITQATEGKSGRGETSSPCPK